MTGKPELKLFRKLSRKAGQTIHEHNLLEDGDRLLMGLSGGKDSLILLEILADRIKAFPFKVELFVVHVIPENIGYHVNTDYLNEFCDKLGTKLITKTIEPDLANADKAPCFLCSWARRKAIFNLTKELNCNKLSFGHHRDDALQTFLMNMLFHGSISSMPYKLKMFEGRLHLIRPMLDIWEKDLIEYSAFKNYSAVEKNCPYEQETKRKYTADILDKMNNDYPKAKLNMFKAMDNIYKEYLPASKSFSKKDPG